MTSTAFLTDPSPIIRRLVSRVRKQVRGHEWGCYADEPCRCGYAQMQGAVYDAEQWLAEQASRQKQHQQQSITT